MMVHYCSESGGWKIESCSDLNCEGTHFSLAAGHDDLCRLLNLIDRTYRGLIGGSSFVLDDIEEIRKWMGTHEE
jgi:hypothetical protein